MNTVLVTGSSGLIGSEVADYFCRLGWEVHGIDNNMRANFFGPAGDTRWNQRRLSSEHPRFHHHELDIRDRPGVQCAIGSIRPALIVHAAAQPSHDLAATRPFDDFDVNAVGTLNLLEATRCSAGDAVFVFMSTNKVYGDRPNAIAMRELPTRWDYADPEFLDGIPEDFNIDRSKHSLFGASKLAADLMVQEYVLRDNLDENGQRRSECEAAAGSGIIIFSDFAVRKRRFCVGGMYDRCAAPALTAKRSAGRSKF
jgi:CDP-paratose 2-epimerase